MKAVVVHSLGSGCFPEGVLALAGDDWLVLCRCVLCASVGWTHDGH